MSSKGCIELIPNADGRFHGLCRKIPIINSASDPITRNLVDIGFENYIKKTDAFLQIAKPVNADFLRLGNGYINFVVHHGKLTRTDFFDKTATKIARLDDDEINPFFDAFRQPIEIQNLVLSQSIDVLSLHKFRYFPESTFKVEGIEIPASVNGLCPDYSLVTDQVYAKAGIWYNGNIRSVNQRIRLSGMRKEDEVRAFANLGITDPDEMESILKGYVWHHLDDFNPKDQSITMQLVLSEFHNQLGRQKVFDEETRRYIGIFEHIGGAKVYAMQYRVKYK